MRYGQRDEAGKLIGHYANPQSYAREELPDDHPDILAWDAARTAARQQVSPLKALEARVTELEARCGELEALIQRVATHKD